MKRKRLRCEWCGERSHVHVGLLKSLEIAISALRGKLSFTRLQHWEAAKRLEREWWMRHEINQHYGVRYRELQRVRRHGGRPGKGKGGR